jgi:hypothetical protein
MLRSTLDKRLVKNFPYLLEAEDSFPCLQNPANAPMLRQLYQVDTLQIHISKNPDLESILPLHVLVSTFLFVARSRVSVQVLNLF